MPIYEYKCRDCDEEFEALVSLSAAASAHCPLCGAGEPKRLMSVIAGMGGRASGGSSFAAGRMPESSPTGTCGNGGCAHCS